MRYRLVRFRLRLLVLFLLRLPVLFGLELDLVAEALALAFRRRVAAPFRAEAERDALDREALPLGPPFREELLVLFFPRPDPLFLPPPSSLFTVAQARRSASRRDTPRFSYPSSMCSAFRCCLLV
jgi:hypothetical protein